MAVQAIELLDALYAGEDLRRRTRVNHARGLFAAGTFTATAEAASLSDSVALNGQPSPVLVRFSSSSGIPTIPDADPGSSPRGLALRISPEEGSSTTLVGHSVEGFPASTPEQFLAFLTAVSGSAAEPALLENHLRGNAAARSFLSRLPPTPASFVLERYHFLHAFALEKGSARTIGRFIVAPAWGLAGGRDPESGIDDFLDEELVSRVRGSEARLAVLFQLAGYGDDVADISEPWRSDSRVIRLGEIVVDAIVADQNSREELMFDPLEVASGVALVGDPMIAVRSEAYRLSLRRRTAEVSDYEVTD